MDDRTPASQPPVFNSNAYSPAEIKEAVEKVGVKKTRLPFLASFMLAIVGGGSIGLGALYYTIVASDADMSFATVRVLGGLAFSLGLALVLVGGAELFTGNNLIVMAWASRKVSTREMLRNWLIVYFGNLVGALGLVVLVLLSHHLDMNGGRIGLSILNTAVAKIQPDVVTLFVKGILCNVLVCLAVWLAYAGRSVTDKILALILPVSAFIAAGFEHCVANMYFLPLAWLLTSMGKVPAGFDASAITVSGIVHNLVPVTLGNIVGGWLGWRRVLDDLSGGVWRRRLWARRSIDRCSPRANAGRVQAGPRSLDLDQNPAPLPNQSLLLAVRHLQHHDMDDVMPLRTVDWEANKDLPLGKGATVQQFLATVGKDQFEINVAPWGEGQLRVNGLEIARTAEAKDRRQAFTSLKQAAERYMRGEPVDMPLNGKARLIPAVKAKLLEGKKGLVVGIANEQSIAWGCAAAFRAFGADLAVTYLNEKAKKHVDPLARALESPIVMPLDVRVPGQMEAVFERIGKEWGKLDFVVHSIAFAPQNALHGRVVDVPLDGFLTTMQVSCWTFLRMAQLAEPLMKKGGTLFTMTYYGSQTVVKNYNIMGVAKAALESAVKYVSAELGPKGIRVHAISPGPLATRAASGIPEFDKLLEKAKAKAPARSLVSIEDVGAATAFLAHDAARLITGDTIYIDGGYHVVD